MFNFVILHLEKSKFPQRKAAGLQLMLLCFPTGRRGWMVVVLSCVYLFVTLWPVAHQTPLSIGFPRQEHWSG